MRALILSDIHANLEALNNYIWLCARCRYRMDDIMKLADRLIEESPNNGMNIDTAAAAYWAAGNKQKAIELETWATRLEPDHEFMQEQLKKFKEQ